MGLDTSYSFPEPHKPERDETHPSVDKSDRPMIDPSGSPPQMGRRDSLKKRKLDQHRAQIFGKGDATPAIREAFKEFQDATVQDTPDFQPRKPSGGERHVTTQQAIGISKRGSLKPHISKVKAALQDPKKLEQLLEITRKQFASENINVLLDAYQLQENLQPKPDEIQNFIDRYLLETSEEQINLSHEVSTYVMETLNKFIQGDDKANVHRALKQLIESVEQTVEKQYKNIIGS